MLLEKENYQDQQELDFQQVLAISKKHNHKRAVLQKLEVQEILDEHPDLSWLETEYEYDEEENVLTVIESCRFDKKVYEGEEAEEILKWIKQDHHRLETYGNIWHMVGIRASATIYLPFEVITNKGKEINFKIEEITSGGLWGIESDSNQEYKNEIGKNEIDSLKRNLEMLNVVIDHFQF